MEGRAGVVGLVMLEGRKLHLQLFHRVCQTQPVPTPELGFEAVRDGGHQSVRRAVKPDRMHHVPFFTSLFLFVRGIFW